jgi:hypothetical protein
VEKAVIVSINLPKSRPKRTSKDIQKEKQKDVQKDVQNLYKKVSQTFFNPSKIIENYYIYAWFWDITNFNP